MKICIVCRFTPEERSRRDPLSFLAFGFGPRNCIGMRFAQLEIRLTLAYLLKRFKFVANDQTPVTRRNFCYINYIIFRHRRFPSTAKD